MLKARIAAIEFVDDEVRVAVVKAGSGLPAILELRACRAEYSEPEDRIEALTRALDTALDQLKTRPAAYVLCANSRFCIVRTLTISFRGRRRVAAAVPFELEPYLAFPLDELLVDFRVVGEFDGETEVLAMAMRRSQLDEQLAVLAGAGISPEAVTLDAVALTGLWHRSRKKLKGLTAVLHVRDGCSNLAILHNNNLAYFRHLPCTAEQVRQTPVAAAREIQNSIRAFLAKWRGEGEIAALQLTGLDLAFDERDALAEAMSMPVEDMVLLSQLKGGALALEDGPAGTKNNKWEAAAGAALGAGGGLYAIDFIRGEREWPGAVRAVTKHLMFSTCLALLALAGWAFYYYQGAQQHRAQAETLRAEIQAIDTELEDLAGQGFPEGIDVEMFGYPPILGILNEIGGKMPEQKILVTSIQVAPPGARSWWLRIQGEVADASVFNEVFATLKDSAMFQVDEEPDLSLQGEVTTFTITAFRPEENSNDSQT